MDFAGWVWPSPLSVELFVEGGVGVGQTLGSLLEFWISWWRKMGMNDRQGQSFSQLFSNH